MVVQDTPVQRYFDLTSLRINLLVQKFLGYLDYSIPGSGSAKHMVFCDTQRYVGWSFSAGTQVCEIWKVSGYRICNYS